jgi:EAL domain-containing protein (putative c-di-GMP-specific phosphodiesterase class I)
VLEKLREIGVDYAQGFAVGMPQPLEKVSAVSVADLLG